MGEVRKTVWKTSSGFLTTAQIFLFSLARKNFAVAEKLRSENFSNFRGESKKSVSVFGVNFSVSEKIARGVVGAFPCRNAKMMSGACQFGY